MYMNMYYPDWLLVLVKLSNYKLSTKGCVIEIGDLVFHKDDLALGVPHSSEQVSYNRAKGAAQVQVIFPGKLRGAHSFFSVSPRKFDFLEWFCHFMIIVL